ncbi:MAG: dihydroxyacetone kinase operon transcriptional regulator DhaR [Candidatus Promineifilaceae bacterium]
MSNSLPDERVAEVWHAFVTSGQIGEEETAVLNPVVLQSWQRCSLRLNPHGQPRITRLKEPLLRTLLQTQEQLITTAVPYLEEIYRLTQGEGYAFLLSDRTGCVLVISGEPTRIAMMEELGLWQGSYWAEEQLGTNGIGVALKTSRPVLVRGAEHYFSAYHHLNTIAAPINDSEGRVLGLLGMVGRASSSGSQALAMVTSVAWAISNQLQYERFRERANHHLTEIQTLLETVHDGIVVWDEEERIQHINERAGQILLLSPTAVVGQRITQVLGLPKIMLEAINHQRHLADVEAGIGVNDRIVQASVSLRPVMASPTEHAGFVLLLQPLAADVQRERRKTNWVLDQLPAVSLAMRQTLRQIRPAVRGKAPILLQGEGGVGKSKFARAIHNGSERTHGPFISMNCRSIPGDKMVDELLGYEKGLGGIGRPGKFELANGGTLLLGQVESLSLEAQSALMHVIETGQVTRTGSTTAVSVDVRIIGTTSANLEQQVTEELFLRSLYYSWSIFNIRIPPLRECLEDIPFLVEQFLTRAGDRLERPIWIEEEALSVLGRYPWPGNVRELEHALERAVYHNQDGWITAMDLPEVVRNGRVMVTNTPQPQPLFSAAEAEREAIIRAGFAFEGNITAMVDYLGLSRTTLWRRMKQLHISAEHFKQG